MRWILIIAMVLFTFYASGTGHKPTFNERFGEWQETEKGYVPKAN